MSIAVFAFLKRHWDGKSPLLLGYSGGPDSKALLYALIACGVAPHVAHVDHGWRKESSLEAEEIRREISSLNLPYYTTRLEGCTTEESARLARLSFFKEISCHAVLLAHQADDWAETALKRVLEGAHLPFLGGMDPVSTWGELTLWRPLLKVPKRELEEYLALLQLTPFYDPTNSDSAYLRSRMRMEILPDLSRSFGKEVSSNLTALAERASELKSYLDRKVAGKGIEELTERVERRHLLQSLAKKGGVTLPKTVLEPLLDAIEAGKTGWRTQVQNLEVRVDKGKVVFLYTS